jgi:geranylgeranyl reductase family protein
MSLANAAQGGTCVTTPAALHVGAVVDRSRGRWETMRYDAIVVGAGPAGSTTAREAAARGLSVLVLEKATFPRDKPCGGGVNVRTQRLLPFALGSVAERPIRGMRISLRGQDAFARSFAEPISHLTQRRRLDAFLAERAMAAGATLREGVTVKEVEREAAGVVVRTGEGTYEGRTLVAADGANGRTAGLAGLAGARWLIVALEGNVTPRGEFPLAWADRLGLDIGDDPGGYGWLFPKGDHLNVGVGVWQPLGPSLRQRLARVTQFYGFEPEELWGVRGHHLPVRQPGAPLAEGNALLVGDAAGLLDPFTGEGIYAAVWSGQVAARHLGEYLSGAAVDLDGYRREVEETLGTELRLAGRVRDVFHLSPGLYVTLIGRAPLAWRFGCRMMQGDRTYEDLARKLGPLAGGLDLVSDAVRAIPALRRRAGFDALVEPPRPERFLRSWGAGARGSANAAG